MRERSPAPLVINGWTIFAHPMFLDPLETLIQKLQGLKQKDPGGFTRKNATKRLAAIAKLAFEVIPQEPARSEYRQGHTLGAEHKHWLRAKFFQQYRLFFRYHAPSKVIVYAWVNDEETLRSYESRVDAYQFFRKMLENDRPPEDWDRLLSEASAESLRLRQLAVKSGADPL